MNFSYDDILPLARGAAFLGSGGGGNTDYADLLLKKQIRKYGSIRMIDFFDLNDDDIVVPIGFMGAPLVEKEKLCGTKELISLIDRIEKMYGKNIAALCPAEIGGSNAFTPLFIAAQRNIPVLDADMLGRAFPELSMVSTHAQGIFPEITFMADSFGNIIEIRCSDFFRLEEYARAITVACGSSSALVIQVLTGKQVKKGALIQKSLSNALQIGRVLLQHDCPSNVTVCARGIINDIDQEIADGFLNGMITITDDGGVSYKVLLQNEYLAVYKDNSLIVASPDIISLVEANTYLPLSGDSLAYGMDVFIMSCPADDLWYTPQGIDLVGVERLKIPLIVKDVI